ncbi:MAG: NAD-dependent epimerase/dehydratase family protein [Eubacteriales bacterium]|nr:NAD-dependent epimerase/dehydratase family protein [Clostridiales bacterium]MDY5836795.1 NAD-dependent epimerase/dehydratase family protein [Eubacteriales bacterium]
MKKSIYVITGASGHLGNVVVKKLLDRGANVRVLMVEDEIPPSLEGLDLQIVRGNLSSRADLERLFQGLNGLDIYVLHMASMITIDSQVSPLVEKVNVTGTELLLDLALEHKAKRFLYCSSVHAIPEKKYNAPISEVTAFDPAWVEGAYAKTKAMASQAVLDASKKGLDVVLVHPSGIIGPYDYEHNNYLNQTVRDFLRGKLTTLVQGGYDFVDVRDVADGLLAALFQGDSGESYILSGHYLSIEDLIKLAAKASGRTPIRRVLRLGLVKLFVPLVEWWGKLRKRRPLYTAYSLYTLNANANFSHAKASARLGYHPRPLKETVEDTVQFIRDQASQGSLGEKLKMKLADIHMVPHRQRPLP